jgi:hypothetical protein
MRQRGGRLKKSTKGTEVSKLKAQRAPGGKCGESGHSIRTCQEMKAASSARAKEVMARYGKTEIGNTQ